MKDTKRLKIKGWKNIYHANSNHKKAALDIPISDKIDFKNKVFLEIKKGHFIMTNTSRIYNNYTIYVPNNTAPKYVKHTLTELKGKNREFNINSCRLQYSTFNNG